MIKTGILLEYFLFTSKQGGRVWLRMEASCGGMDADSATPALVLKKIDLSVYSGALNIFVIRPVNLILES